MTSPRPLAVASAPFPLEISRTTLCGILLFVGAVLCLSPLFGVVVPLRGNLFALAAAAGIVALRFDVSAFNRPITGIVLLVLAAAGISAWYWVNPRMMTLPIYFVSSLLAVSVLTRRDVEVFSVLLTWLCFAMLIGAVVGTVYAFLGGEPLFAFVNPDGRLNQLYLTTLTNAQYENFIRPSGIFDEPGALSFVVCAAAALRHFLGMGRRATWRMLFLGLVTLSVAHMLYMIVHAAEEMGSANKLKALGWAVLAGGLLIALVTYVPAIQQLYATFLLARFAINGGTLVGDNRTDLFYNALAYLDTKTFWFGLDVRCATAAKSCIDLGYRNYGDNPLTLAVHWGFLLSFPYYFGLAYLAVLSGLRRSLLPLGILLLLLQRPYTMSYGYALLILVVVATVLWRRRGGTVAVA